MGLGIKLELGLRLGFCLGLGLGAWVGVGAGIERVGAVAARLLCVGNLES